MRRITGQLAAMGMLLACLGVQAADILDDARSPRQQYVFQFDWVIKEQQALDPSASSNLSLQAATINDVEVRLDTSAYVGQMARIYLRLPALISGLEGSTGMAVAWTTKGLFAQGQTIQGDRALIFQGVIEQEVMSGFFTFTFEVDARQMISDLRFSPIYEIEVQ